MTFNEWIKSKGVDKVSDTLGISAATTYSWMRRQTIPRNAWPDIVLKFAELGINDMIKMEKESLPDKASEK